MTLTRQLWILILVIIVLAFIGSFIVSGFSARNYYTEQLTVKNIDNAASLALSLSQMDKDPVTLELMIAAQFDTGHYERIELVDPDGQTIKLRQHADIEAEVPAWFARTMDLDIPPGVAQVQDGWHQFGTLYIESQSAYALAALWRVFYRSLAWFLSIAVVCGLLGSLVLRSISRPLQAVVAQAEALGERRFFTSKEPRTLEFMRVVRAMNALTRRVRAMLEAEARRLDEVRRQSQLDPATGVANREQFFRDLNARLSLHDQSVQDGLVLVRITGLQALNVKLDHAGTDDWIRELLKRLQVALEQSSDCYSGYRIGRLNGSDFALLLHDVHSLTELAESLWEAVQEFVAQRGMESEYPVAMAGSYYHPGDERARLVALIDELLAKAEQAPVQRLQIAGANQKAPLFQDAADWRAALERALDEQAISHACYPVLTREGLVLHEEAMLRLRIGDKAVNAGAVIGWARRLGFLPKLDLEVLDSVLRSLAADSSRKIAVNVSVETLRDAASFLELIKRVQAQPRDVACRLSLEFNEQVALQHPSLLVSLSAAVKGPGVMIGLQSAGRNIQAITGLEKLGLDYMKVDSSLIQHQTGDVQNLLRGLCKLGHSLGLTMIAEGVLENVDQAELGSMGFDAFTGLGIEGGDQGISDS